MCEALRKLSGYMAVGGGMLGGIRRVGGGGEKREEWGHESDFKKTL